RPDKLAKVSPVNSEEAGCEDSPFQAVGSRSETKKSGSEVRTVLSAFDRDVID
ncbi:hypothetical protein BaRGS_00010265, partial [Batillaria attramentaria]